MLDTIVENTFLPNKPLIPTKNLISGGAVGHKTIGWSVSNATIKSGTPSGARMVTLLGQAGMPFRSKRGAESANGSVSPGRTDVSGDSNCKTSALIPISQELPRSNPVMNNSQGAGNTTSVKIEVENRHAIDCMLSDNNAL